MNTDQLKKNIQTGWEQVRLRDVSDIFSGGTPDTSNKDFWNGKISWITPTEITKTGKYIQSETEKKITETGLKNSSAKLLPKGSLIVCTRATVGECSISTYPISTNQGFKNLVPRKDTTVDYLYYFIKSIKPRLMKLSSGSTFLEVSKADIENIAFSLPPLTEQNRIVSVLETWDKAIELLKKKIEIKKVVKKGLMQELLTGKRRLPGFIEKWKKVRLGEVSINLDNKRIPLNSEERANKKGAIPYCGANGIVDYINEYIFDEDIILVAEDGGQFDEYADRPIAYRMTGKCWVNNHAHVIKAKRGFSQDLLFYLTVHKNILRYLNGGTRAKLNKSELLNIEYFVPTSENEQRKLASLFNITDQEISVFLNKLEALKQQKTFLLNKLITGQIRTPENLKIFS